PGEPVVVPTKVINGVFQKASDYRARDLLAGSPGMIEYLEVRMPEKEPVILTTKNSKWVFEKPDFGLADYQGVAGGEPSQPTGVHALLVAATNLQVVKEGGFVTDNPSKDDLTKYGLESEKSAEMIII